MTQPEQTHQNQGSGGGAIRILGQNFNGQRQNEQSSRNISNLPASSQSMQVINSHNQAKSISGPGATAAFDKSGQAKAMYGGAPSNPQTK